MVAVWVIDAADGAQWREFRYEGQPAHLAIRLRLAPTADGVAVAGVQVERQDGRALTARDLRLVRFPPNWVLFGEAVTSWYGSGGDTPAVATPRKGARLKDDAHWRDVYTAWQRAMQAAPRAPVKWLLASGRWPVTDATMRRWVTRARDRAAELGWDGDDALPQIAGQNLRRRGEPPAGTQPAAGPDSA